jgi:hypothetical protein
VLPKLHLARRVSELLRKLELSFPNPPRPRLPYLLGCASVSQDTIKSSANFSPLVFLRFDLETIPIYPWGYRQRKEHIVNRRTGNALGTRKLSILPEEGPDMLALFDNPSTGPLHGGKVDSFGKSSRSERSACLMQFDTRTFENCRFSVVIFGTRSTEPVTCEHRLVSWRRCDEQSH